MTDIMTAIQSTIVADLAPGVRDAKIALDRIFSEIVDTSEAVYAGNMGRDWKVIHTYVTNVCGAIKAYPDAMGDDIKYSSAGGMVYTTTPRTWPGLGQTVAPAFMQREVTLKEWMGSMHIPHQITRASRLTNSIVDGLSTLIKQTAKGVAQARAGVFFAETSIKDLATVDVIDTTVADYDGTADAPGLWCTVKTGRIRRFQPGMLITVRQGAVIENDTTDPIVIVESVDPLNKKIKLKHVTTGAVWNHLLEAVNGITLHLYDSVSGGPSGINDWMKDTGTITPLNIDVDAHPEFKSMIDTSLGAVLTAAVLRQKCGEFMDAYGADMMFDTMLTTAGVIAGYVSEADDLLRYNVQGTAVAVKGGFKDQADYPFEYNGTPIRFRSSALVTPGVLYGLKLRNGNIKRYAPPRLPDAGQNQYFNDGIEFVAPTFGVNGIWMPALYNDNVTENAQAPYCLVEEYAPEQCQGMKISGITEWIA